MDKPSTPLARKFRRSAWFALGAVFALAEYLPGPLFRASQRPAADLQRADRSAGFIDGFDQVADFLCHPLRRNA